MSEANNFNKDNDTFETFPFSISARTATGRYTEYCVKERSRVS